MKQKRKTKSSSHHSSSCFKPFISPNPITSFNPVQRFPRIDKTAFVSQFSSVIGDVSIKQNVYVAPNVSIRADEGTPFSIGANTNLQDGVILHGLLNQRITVGKKSYSIFIGNEEFPSSYHLLFGKHRCSCGLAYDYHKKWIND